MPLTARQYFTLRRLHSLTGVLPVGVFLLEHFFTNSFALYGAAEYGEKIEFLKSLPYLYLIEIFGIALPIAFHALLGVWIWTQGRTNVGTLPYRQNWMFTVQRVTGVFLVFYIGYHVVTTRFAHWFGDDNGASALFGLMQQKLENPLVASIYVLGILAASFHLGNGLWGFAIHWGLLTTRRAQLRFAWVAVLIGVTLAGVGLNSLLAFKPFGLSPITIFQEQHTTPAGTPHGALMETSPR